MKQAIEAPEVHKSSEVGDILYHPLANLAHLQRRKELVAIFFSLFFNK